MAQRTAFLNSDAKGYNKDFHHTWIHNYLLQQVGVMFTNYSTKPEFKLGDGQISAGKAIIRCTRTTGTFAGSKMLALYESTATESISTSGNKKVFIEIPEIFINDSSAITDTLTQGINLGVGVIKSETDYPNHTNYIPLWEITGGDWANAVDVRPEILYRGQPNSISYFDNNGVERKLVLDSGSLNKFLKSNGAGVEPSRAEVGDVVEVANLKNTFFAGEDILPKSMFKIEREIDTIDAIDENINCGYDNNTNSVQLNTILSGDDFDTIKANIEGFNSPADVVEVRIESVDSNGNATGSLIHVDAYGTVTPTDTMGEVLITLNGTISGMVAGTPVAVVFSRSGALSTSNYYKIGVATADTGIRHIKTFNGTSWNKETGKKGYISSDGFLDEGAIQSKSTTVFLSEYTGYCEAGVLAGNDFTGITTGMVDVDNMSAGDKVYLTDTGEIDNVEGAVKKQVGTALRAGLVELGVRSVGGGGSNNIVIELPVNDSILQYNPVAINDNGEAVPLSETEEDYIGIALETKSSGIIKVGVEGIFDLPNKFKKRDTIKVTKRWNKIDTGYSSVFFAGKFKTRNNGRVYFNEGDNIVCFNAMINDVEWISRDPTPNFGSDSSSAMLDNDTIYIAGGQNGSVGYGFYKYDVNTKTSTFISESPYWLGGYKHGIVKAGKSFYTLCGYSENYSVVKYDTENSTWTNLGEQPIQRKGVAVPYGNKLLVVYENEEVYMYDTDNNTWTQKNYAPGFVTDINIYSGSAYTIIGNSVYKYNISSDSWSLYTNILPLKNKLYDGAKSIAYNIYGSELLIGRGTSMGIFTYKKSISPAHAYDTKGNLLVGHMVTDDKILLKYTPFALSRVS